MKRSIIIALVALAALTTTAQADWTDELTEQLKASKVSGERDIRVSHCGKVRKSDLSITVREAWKGIRPDIESLGSSKYRVSFMYLNELTKRYVKFVCHHSG